MRKIFISYRRAEAEYAAGALGRDLRRHFGDDQIFRDKEDIGGGVSWKQHVLHEIDQGSALLVLIGKDWANVKDPQGRRRLDSSDDPLRLEIADGIRDGATILPVLLENAQMPEATDLPEVLRPLADLNALRLRDGDWQYDLSNILRTLEKEGFAPVGAAAQSASPAPQANLSAASKGMSVKVITATVVTLLALVALASDELDRDGHIGVALFSIVGLVLGVLAWRENKREASAGRVLSIVVSCLAVLGLIGGLGNMNSKPVAPKSDAVPAVAKPHSDTQVAVLPDATTPELKASNGLAVLSLLKGHALLRYDPARWQEDKPTATQPPGTFIFHDASGEVFFKVIAERIQIGLKTFPGIGLTNAQAADPLAKVTQKGPRSVNGLDMVFQEIEATIDDVPWTFYVHYYSDTSGSVQLVGYTGRALIAEHRSTIEQFVAGFNVAERTP
jgi:hypothetical protein